VQHTTFRRQGINQEAYYLQSLEPQEQQPPLCSHTHPQSGKDDLSVLSIFYHQTSLKSKHETFKKTVFYQYYDANLACLHTSSFGAFLSARVILDGFFLRSSATFCQYLPVIAVK
jgi:hypothetical protein